MGVKLEARAREVFTKSANNKLRRNGLVPAIIYGKGKDSKSISVDELELVKTLRDEGRNAIISLAVENDNSYDVMLHDYQMHALRDELVHADFFVVDMSEELEVAVPLRVEGEAKGTKEGGVLQQPLFELLVRAKPRDIPEEIVVDVSELGIGDVITVADLPVGENYGFAEEADTTVFTVTTPTVTKESDADAEGNVEPELVNAQEAKKNNDTN